MINQIKMIGTAKYHFFGFSSIHKFLDSSRYFSNMSQGINLIVKNTRNGKRTKSSRYPSTGIKSGIKSTGERA